MWDQICVAQLSHHLSLLVTQKEVHQKLEEDFPSTQPSPMNSNNIMVRFYYYYFVGI